MRPQEVQMREFEVCQPGLVHDIPSLHLIHQVLEKVKHENIVKLLAIEEEQEGRGKVIMSGRSGSSWLNLMFDRDFGHWII